MSIKYRVTESCLQEFSPNLKIFEVNYGGNLVQAKDFTIYQILPPTKIKAMSQKRLAEYFMARLCVKYALNQFNYHHPLILDKSVNGKIILPSGFTGSISHAESLAIACISRIEQYAYIGIDVEKIVNYELYNQLSDYVLSRSEMALISDANNSSPETLFTLIFSAKETLFKAISSIIDESFDFHSTKVINFDRKGIVLALDPKLSKRIKLPPYVNIHYKISENHVYTLCYF